MKESLIENQYSLKSIDITPPPFGFQLIKQKTYIKE